MKAVIKIQMDNAAFDELETELARILTEAANRLTNGSQTTFGLYDINGNKVGELKVTR
jgi:hypothetical protein